MTVEHESGDRASLLARLGGGLVEPAPVNLAHPLPGPLAVIPTVVSARLDPSDLVGSFCTNAAEHACTVQRVGPDGVPGAVRSVVERHGVERAVVSAQAEIGDATETLRSAGVEIAGISREACAHAQLGITAADAAIATTGSVVQRSDTVGGRTASLLPPVFCCIVPAERIVGRLTDALAMLDPTGMPANVVMITGPSRSGDIENIIVRGVHGPVAVELIVIDTD